MIRGGAEKISRFEVELLLAFTLEKPREFLLAHPEYLVPEKISAKFLSLIERRCHHEPISFITRKKEFFSRTFSVNRHTLIPRPETEFLVEKTLEYVSSIQEETPSNKKNRPIKNCDKEKILILDIGTGSGNIITTLAAEIGSEKTSEKNISFVATDISKEALSIARKNATAHASNSHIRFIRSNLLEKIPKKFFRDTHSVIVVANLPYLSSAEYESAPPDVRNFEPSTALWSGKDGLDHYRSLFEALHIERHREQFRLEIFLEISPSQMKPMQTLTQKYFPTAHTEYFRDLARKWRLVHISLSK